jgi:hypothetical protein
VPRARASQCAYKEGGRRCVRNGDGTPPLCRPHRVVFEETARRAAQPKSAIGEIFEDLFSGRGIRPEKVASAVDEVMWGMGGGFGAHHEIFEDDVDTETPPRNHTRRPPPWEPPPPSEHAQKSAAIRAAKVELGFAQSEPITEESVAQRRRELARKHHPDLGGSVAKMQRINNAADILLASL